jgi:hypothetical protein
MEITTEKLEEKVTISEIAHQNHELLWPNYQSKIKENDPEFIVLFLTILLLMM